MKILILKLGATGDVVRTTPLLRRLAGDFTWVTAAKNLPLLTGLEVPVRVVSWENRARIAGQTYDLAINLEDDAETAGFLRELNIRQIVGAYLGESDQLAYTEDARGWFDLSLISRFGREKADGLKLKNRSTYQELIFRALNLSFEDETYLLPATPLSLLTGDVAISSVAGPVWPMKQWAYYTELQEGLESRGLVVNVLPKRSTLLEHLADVRGHRCLVSGDSLPMHLALGSGVRCVSIFTCTSPWEICGYDLQTKVISPRLNEFFYQRGFDERSTTAVSLEEVLTATLTELARAGHLSPQALR